jgi:hypothetical protein
MRFEIEVELRSKVYSYAVAFRIAEPSKELGVFEERLAVDGRPVFSRDFERVPVAGGGFLDYLTLTEQGRETEPSIDWHVVALPIFQEPATEGPLFVFKRWLARMLILRPQPALIMGDSRLETLQPNPEVTDFGAWFSGLLNESRAASARIDEFLREVMPDLKDIRNPLIGRDSRSLFIQFANERSVTIPFEDLSDGEKCFMICAVALAANEAYGPLLCFWDEPDSHLALDEVGQFVLALRRAFQPGGQFIATSHNPEAIRSFSDENTLLLYRKNHLEPTIVRPLSEIQVSGDLVSALVRGDVEP